MNAYIDNPNHIIQEVLENGFCKLKPLKDFVDLDKFYYEFIHDKNLGNYTSSHKVHRNLIDVLDLNSNLFTYLFQAAKINFNYRGNPEDQYHISRHVKPGENNESYRAHFDSHIFTIVFPIKIPNNNSLSNGELVIFPRIRRDYQNELTNTLEKIYYKRYANKKSFEKFAEKKKALVISFEDTAPIVFLGRSTLHSNRPLQVESGSSRLTFLTHLYDPSPKWGVGEILRKIRAR